MEKNALGARLFDAVPVALPDGGSMTLDCHAMAELTIISGAGATVTYSRVDAESAVAHVSGTQNGGTIAPATKLTIAIDWPFFHISVTGGDCRVALT